MNDQCCSSNFTEIEMEILDEVIVTHFESLTENEKSCFFSFLDISHSKSPSTVRNVLFAPTKHMNLRTWLTEES